MIGKGPPRSGWLMKVVVLPSLVEISICWSIMVMLFPVISLLARPLITIVDESQPESRPVSAGRAECGLELRGADGHCLQKEQRRFCMTQTSNRFFDEIGRLMNDAAGAAQGVKREVDTVVRNQAERILRDLDIVKREEFEVVKDMARLAREENETLKARIAVLEAKLGIGTPPTDPMSAA